MKKIKYLLLSLVLISTFSFAAEPTGNYVFVTNNIKLITGSLRGQALDLWVTGSDVNKNPKTYVVHPGETTQVYTGNNGSQQGADLIGLEAHYQNGDLVPSPTIYTALASFYEQSMPCPFNASLHETGGTAPEYQWDTLECTEAH